MRSSRLPKELQRLLTKHEVHAWDYVLIGDGSGSVWRKAAGWGVLVFDAAAPETLDVMCGGVNSGTNNFGELMAYFHALAFVSDLEAQRKASGLNGRIARVSIFSDSNYCVQGGNAVDRQKKTHGALWAGIDAVARMGLVLKWHLVPRDTDDYNRLCDTLSKAARRRNTTKDTRKLLD